MLVMCWVIILLGEISLGSEVLGEICLLMMRWVISTFGHCDLYPLCRNGGGDASMHRE